MSDPASEFETGIDLSAVARGWKTLLASTLGVMAMGAVLLLGVAPMQDVTARIIVEQREVAMGGVTRVVRDREFLPTQAEILSSPAVIAAAVEQLDGPTPPELMPRRVGAIISNLKVDPLAGTGVIQIQYADLNAEKAAETVNALVDSYSDYVSRIEQQRQHDLKAALTARAADLQDNLNRLQSEYEELKLSDADTTPTDAVATARIVASLESAIATAESQRIALERATSRLKNSPWRLSSLDPAESPGRLSDLRDDSADGLAVLRELLALNQNGLTGIPDPAPIEERARMARARLNDLRLRFGPDHPEMRAAAAAVSASEKEMERFAARIPETLQRAVESVSLQEKALKQRYDAHLRMSSSHKVTLMKESQKLQELDRSREALEAVQARLEQMQIVDTAVENGQAGTFVSVLERPTPVATTFVANPVIVLGLAGFVGLLAGLLLLAIPSFARRVPPSADLVPGL